MKLKLSNSPVQLQTGSQPPPPHWGFAAGISAVLLALLLAGCARAPIGADRVTTRAAYRQVAANALNSSKLSAQTVSLLHRYDLELLAAKEPVEALLKLHQKALDNGDRDLLFAMSELSFQAGNWLSHNVKPWEARDPRDYYLGASVYAYLFLFGEATGTKPDAFDRRFRMACDLYNSGLSWALTERRGTNAVVRLEGGRRRLPVGEIALNFNTAAFPWTLDKFEEFLAADQFSVRGLSVRNREAGVGAPLIAVSRVNEDLRMRRSARATIFLRADGSLADFAAGKGSGALELYSGLKESTVTIGGKQVPLEMDLTAPRAYTMNQSSVWSAGNLLFFTPDRAMKNQLILPEPYTPGRVPVILVHGTFSSPVPWMEMGNTLEADPVLRQHYQIWLYMYSSSQPLVYSAAAFREVLTEMVHKVDPNGEDAALQQMVIIGHSQGGLMAKMTATDSGDQLWRVFSDKPLEDLQTTEANSAEIRRLLFLKPLPFVKRTVFVSTPHRGSYQNRNIVQRLGRWLVELPSATVQKTSDLLTSTEGIKVPEQIKGKTITSLDGMSVSNPVMLKLADIPLAPGVTGHSIISVKGDGDYHEGRDGVVDYPSAHVDYVKSEFIVRSKHSCQTQPDTIEEVRRILYEHLALLPGSVTNKLSPAR